MFSYFTRHCHYYDIMSNYVSRLPYSLDAKGQYVLLCIEWWSGQWNNRWESLWTNERIVGHHQQSRT